MTDSNLVIKSSPHFKTTESVPRIMWIVTGTLVPALAMGIYTFGPRAVLLLLTTTLGAVVAEMLAERWREGSWVMPSDGSAVVTGILLAMCLPPSFPLFEGFLGGVVSIAIGKQVFGGLGNNIFNPALVGRAFLQAAFPVQITTWTAPRAWLAETIDAVSTATPLAKLIPEGGLAGTVPCAGQTQAAAAAGSVASSLPSVSDMFFGFTGGSMGETSAIALLIGGVVLLVMRYIDWRVPVGMIGTVFVLTAILHYASPEAFPAQPFMHVFAGGLILGAMYMATDMVTSPMTALGRFIFAVGAGFLVVVIRVWGNLPEGVMYSILLMNAVTPIIDRYIRPRRFAEAAE